MARQVLLQTHISGLPVRRGKVRDIYDLGERLLIVASDRISAFDWVLPNGIPDKGRVLTQLSRFWFEHLGVPNHMITCELSEMELPFDPGEHDLAGRAMLVRKAAVAPVECVVRGYLAGSGWREYKQDRSVCGIKLPDGLRESDKLPEPIFTPATKAEKGHDENISFARMCELVGWQTAELLRARSVEVYAKAADYAAERGIIIADTKFEWGQCDGQWLLVDEVLTPDSSRFWPADQYEPGRSQPRVDGGEQRAPPDDVPDEEAGRDDGERYHYLRPFRHVGHTCRSLHSRNADVQPVGDKAEDDEHGSHVQGQRVAASPGAEQQQHRDQHEPDFEEKEPGLGSRLQGQTQDSPPGEVQKSKRQVEQQKHRQDSRQAGKQFLLQWPLEGPAAVPGLENSHRQTHADGGNKKEDRQQRRVPERIELMGNDQVQAAERGLVQRRKNHADDHQRRQQRLNHP